MLYLTSRQFSIYLISRYIKIIKIILKKLILVAFYRRNFIVSNKQTMLALLLLLLLSISILLENKQRLYIYRNCNRLE